ncbi:uncharacterized protein LOC123547438 [Mercenaria mercenaria]|uniref:uncharacterized protein LOC123547438 n=1 Tax=Mercenaria mercenaria TaxID=6596 RepID=UPI00234F2311|nr:uncharacterized protein LOC123547438 [Mercenaria mercenaria]
MFWEKSSRCRILVHVTKKRSEVGQVSMENNKDFEAYAKGLFGEDYNDKKTGKLAAPWPEKQEYHPKPFDIVVVDKNDKVSTAKDKDKKYKTGIGKSLNANKKPPNNDGRLTPIVIDMNDTPLEQEKDDAVFKKKRKSEEQEFDKLNFKNEKIPKDQNDKKKNKSKLERVRFEADDSGISLNEEGEESDSDLAYFCVDHMQMCNSRSEFRKHRNCHLDYTKSGTSSPAGRIMTENRSGDMTDRRLPFLSGGSRASRRGRSSAAFAAVQTMYTETLEKLYAYSGVIIEDRQSLKKELRDKKLIMEETMMEFMEELITRILKLKNQFLAELERKHKTNQAHITHQITRLYKMRSEAQEAWESLQVPSDYNNFEEYKNIILKTAERSVILQVILREIFESCKHYNYVLKSAPEAAGIYDTENLACVKEIFVAPVLPPFLSVKTTEDADDESVSDYTSLKCIEGFENVSGKHASGNEKCSFTGCAYIMEDFVLLADWSNGSIKMLNKQGLVADVLEFEQSPWDVARNYSGQVVVTVPKLQTVFFVEAEPHLRIVGHFETRCDCFGICKIRDNYAITCDPWSKSPSVRVFDKLGNTLLKVQTDDIGDNYFKCPLHVCSDFFSSVIYVSDATADCVYAISVSGDIIFCYKHENLEYPTGVETDRNNCLHVCGKASSNIHKLTNNGSLQEVLLKNNYDVQHPCGIAFHPNGDHMILTDLEGEMSSGYWKLHFW